MPAVGCEIPGLLVYGFNLPPPTACAMQALRSHATRFGIQFSLTMKGFTTRQTLIAQALSSILYLEFPVSIWILPPERGDKNPNPNAQ
jgi:hypothetical protein